MLKYTLKQLEIFVAVAERNSFTKAAESLYLTQSTVSAHIGALEAALGMPLFSRDARRNVRLTAEGQRLYPAVKRVLRCCAELTAAAEHPEAALPLLLGASTVPAQYILPELLAAFLERNAASRYLLKKGNSLQIHALLREDTIRIGLVGTVLDTEHLNYVPVAEDRLVMVTPNNDFYRKKKQQGVLGCELLGEPTIAREEGSGTDRTVAAYLRERDFPAERLRIVARIDNPEVIKRMVARGAGVSVLSAMAVREGVAAGQLLPFELDPQGLRRKIYRITKKNAEFSPLESQFLRFCAEYPHEASAIE